MRLNARRHLSRVGPTALAASALLAGTLAFAPRAGATTASIDTTSSWNGFSTVSPFGYANTATYGQTVTVPADDPQLDSFTFYMSLPTNVLFRGEVYAWDDVSYEAVGGALYESGSTHTDSNALQAITFDTGGLRLTAGAKYILITTVSQDYAADANTGAGSFGFVSSDVYSGGGFFFNNDGGHPSLWTTSSWQVIGFLGSGIGDLAFKADFSPADGDLGMTAAPADITVDATGPSGAGVTYIAPTATDEDGPTSASVTCSAPSGSTFPIGTTAVTCTASDQDDSNSPVSASFTVTVQGAPQQVGELRAAVQGAGPGASLEAKLALAQSYLAQGDIQLTCSTLASFVHEVDAQAGRSLPPGTAGALAAEAERIEAVLSC
jgi:hypothetical protein